MEYLRPYAFSGEETLLAAWETQVSEISQAGLSLTTFSRAELFSRFAKTYGDLRRLPRGARRAMLRRLGRSVPAWQARFATSIAGAALLLALAQGAQAAIITVNTPLAKINDGDGFCSLIEAIVNANDDAATFGDCAAGSGADIINLPALGTISVNGTYTHYIGATGLPTITSEITISGNGGKIVAKKGGGFRLFAVESSGDLTLDNVTLSGGSQNYGGAILNYGTLTLTDTTVTGARAGLGGAIFNNAAALTIDNSVVSKNNAVYGGGIYDYAGILTVTDSTITGNKAVVDGGGIYEKSGSLDLEYSTVSKNLSGRDGAGLHHRDSSVLIGYSTISANKTGFFGYGGGIFDRSGTTDIINSTISGNKAAVGGGIYNRSTMTISNTTIAKNSAGDGGGIFTVVNDLTLARTLISGNSAFFARNVDRFSGTVTRDNYNLFGSSNYDGVRGFSVGASDIVPNVSVTSILLPLASNGGPTQTHALTPASPAVDASPADADCAPADQRGVARPQGASCDIGAFER